MKELDLLHIETQNFVFFETQNSSVWANSTLTFAIDASTSRFENYYGGYSFKSFTTSGVPLTNQGWTMNNNLYPDTAGVGASIGIPSNRVALYGISIQITDSGAFPITDKTKDLGSNQAAFRDLYLGNSPVITSNRADKLNEQPLNDLEIKCAIACGKLIKRYQMKNAVELKGEDDARYHVGVIAQDIIQCFTDYGLDWTKYGMIVYEKWDAKDAIIEEWEADTRTIPEYINDDGIVVPSETIVIKEAGSIIKENAVEAGESYKIRYDELNCFIMNGIIHSLDSLLK